MAAFNYKSYLPKGLNPGAGYVEGAHIRETEEREKEKGARAERYTQIAESDSEIRQETQSFKREDREKETSIQEGMADAGRRGGYEGVIEFLKQVDPVRGLKFHSAKLQLDKQIMGNDVMKATSKLTKDKALVESYGLIGKMGHAIMQAPEKERNAMFQQARPMWEKIIPGVSKTWNKQMEHTSLLASAQATPANQLFKANATLAADRSRIGKLNGDIENRQANGQTASNSPGLKSLLMDRERLEANSQKATLTKTEQTLKAAERNRDDQQKQLKHAKSISKDIRDQSKPFVEFTDLSTKIEGSLQKLANDPQNFPAKAMIGRSIAKMANGVGVLTQPDVDELIRSDSSYSKALKIAQSMVSGKKVDLSDREVEDLKGLYKALERTALSKQLSLESAHEDQINKYPGAVDINNVIMPSQAYKSFKSKMSVDSRNKDESRPFLQKVPPQFQEKAQELLDAGHSLQDVQNALKEKMSQQQEQR